VALSSACLKAAILGLIPHLFLLISHIQFDRYLLAHISFSSYLTYSSIASLEVFSCPTLTTGPFSFLSFFLSSCL
ncbi:hypothetical protein F5050DRAFT_1733849, partial [Lentinula boryana]